MSASHPLNIFSTPKGRILNILRQARKALDLTQKEMAKRLGLEPGTYAAYENGTRRAPDELLERALALAKAVPGGDVIEFPREAVIEATKLAEELLGAAPCPPDAKGRLVAAIGEWLYKGRSAEEVRDMVRPVVAALLPPE